MAHEVNTSPAPARPLDPRLFLRDEELDRGVALILAAERRLATAANAAADAAGLNTADCALLLALRARPGRRLGEVRADLGATTPTFARVLGRLDKQGFIAKQRGLSDGRERRLSLSPEGEAAVAAVAEAMREAMKRAYREAGAENVAGARAVLEALTP